MPGTHYKSAQYSVSIEVPSPPSTVFTQLTALQNWWPEEYVGDVLQLDSEFIFRIGDSHYSKNKVVEFNPGKRLVWLTTESHRQSGDFDWSGTKFIFEITPHAGNTQVQFTYDGVVLAHEAERLVHICDMTIKEMLYNYLTSYTTNIEVNRPSTELFQCITQDVSKWWGGKDLAGKTCKLGDQFTIHHPGAHFSTQKLVEVIPNKRLAWLVTEGRLHWLRKDQNEWTNTKMVFELMEKANTTILHFTHVGLTPEKECYERVSQGWTTVINDYLFNWVTKGIAHFE